MKECKSKYHNGDRILPLTEFRKRAASKDGYASQCKQCADLIVNRWHDSNHERKYEKQVERRRTLLEQWREWKTEQGCKFCDETFGPCLQLHHLESEEKEHNVSNMIARGNSWESIMEEANKGIVVCSNCHTKIHYDFISV